MRIVDVMRCKRTIGILWLLLVACAALVSGCEAAADKAAGQCAVDSDCVAGLKCFQARFCVAAQVAETPVVVRVTPPVGSGYVVEQFKVTLTGADQGEVRKLVLTEPAVIRGTVTQKDAEFGGAASIPGTLLATSPGDVEGRDLSFQATSFENLQLFAGATDPQGYELRVQKGHTYALTFWPQSDEIPPHYSTLTAGDSIERWDLVLPAQAELRLVTGRILTGDNQPVVGMGAWLRDDDGRLWSTRGVTDATGRYTFKVDASAPRAHLAFGPSPSATGPAARMPWGMVQAPLDVTLLTGDLPPVQLGAMPTETTSVVHVVGADGKPVSGATVELRVSLQDPPDDVTLTNLAVSVSGVTDAAGNAQLTVANAPGELRVLPPPKSQSARLTLKDALLQPGQTNVTLKSRVRVTGRVQDFASRTVDGAQVTVRELDSEDDADWGGEEDSFTVLPDATGAFAIWLDPGAYAVWVDPPPGAALARVLWSPKILVTPDSASTAWSLTLPPPIVLNGEVLTAAGQALMGVQIDVLAEKVRQNDAATGGAGGKDGAKQRRGTVMLDTHLLGTALSNASGGFEVLLAPGQVAPK